MNVIHRMIDHAYELAMADTVRLVLIQTHNLTRLQSIADALPTRVFSADRAACAQRSQIRVQLLTLRQGANVLESFNLETCIFPNNLRDGHARYVFDPETIKYYLDGHAQPVAHALLHRYADMTVPDVGSVWVHYNKKTTYEILFVTNEHSEDQQRYPTTVVYRGLDNGRLWSRPLNDWHRSMTEITNA